MDILKKILFIIILLSTSYSYSKEQAKNTGPLPRHNADKLKQKKAEIEKKIKLSSRNNAHDFSCYDYLLNPGGNLLYYNKNTEEFFYLLRKSKNPSSTRPDTQYKYYLYVLKLNEKPFIIKKLLSSSASLSAGILGHGRNTYGVSIISFDGYINDCFMGKGKAISIPLPSRSNKTASILNLKPVNSIKHGRYKIVDGTFGRYFADLQKQFIREIDLMTFQQRSAFRFAKDETPIYWDSYQKSIYVWSQTNLRTLKRYQHLIQSAKEELLLKDDEKLLQNGPLFAVAKLVKESNTIIIKHNLIWTNDQSGSPSFTISLPQAYSVSEAAIDINFKRKKLLAYGGGLGGKRSWDKLMVFDYRTGMMLSDLVLKRGVYCDYAKIDSKAKLALFVLINKTTNLHSSLIEYNFKTNQWFTIPFK